MKSYTDIEQSKKLAKILPLESADMWYSYYGNSKYNPTIAYKGQQWFLCQIRNSLHDDIPCWSLAALIEILRQRKDCNSLNTHTNFTSSYFVETSYYKNANWQKISCVKENFIDACVKMILELHELNLL